MRDLEKRPQTNHVYSMSGLDLKKLSVRNRKRAFVRMLLPSIDVVNLEIERDIKIVETLSKKRTYTVEEKKELYRIFNNYKVAVYNWSELKKRMIKYPTSLILSQAALESGWGTSKLFRENNNLFGMTDSSYRRRRYQDYDSIKDSVKDFVLTLSRAEVYRPLRARVRSGEEPRKIAHGLNKYSELGYGYVRKVQTMLDHNNFEKYDS